MLAHAGQSHLAWVVLHPVPLAAILLAAVLYLRAVRILRGRGRAVPRRQQAAFFAGLSLVAVALLSGLDPLGERYLLSAHMAQHLLIADIPGPLLLIGVRAPVLYFLWPKAVLVPVARSRPLRRAWTWLTRPPIALTTWLVVLYAWHLPALYQLALRDPVAHAAEHVMFAFAGMLAWWPLLDPTHHRATARAWKAFYVVVARLVGGILGIVMIVRREPLYPFYGDAARHFGISPRTDQQIAGAMMMALDFLIATIGFFWFISLTAPQKGANRHVQGRE